MALPVPGTGVGARKISWRVSKLSLEALGLRAVSAQARGWCQSLETRVWLFCPLSPKGHM